MPESAAVPSPERWRRLDEIFQAALDLPLDQRDEYLNQACGSDQALRKEAESLLASDRPDSPVISSIIKGLAASMVEDPIEIPSHPDQQAAFVEERFIPGTIIAGRYRMITLLGRGGMGEVYRATDLTLGQPVALKFLPAEAALDQRLLERFHGEVRMARQVSHPNVCRVYDIGEAGGMPFLSMEYVDGEDLACLLRRIGRLPADKALSIARRLCEGLAAAHARGIMHRDLKPGNIMINKSGDVVIMDFGLAAIDSQFYGAEARNGTPAYMAPEQRKGTQVTTRSDIYALGLVLYELFTGRRPYDGTTVERLLEQQEAAQFPSMTGVASDIEPAVERAIRACLAPDPAKRPPSALAVAAALPGGDPLAAALAAGETPSPEAVAAGKTQGLPIKYSMPCLVATAVLLLLAPLALQNDAFLYAPSYSPQVLEQKSRDVAAALGYPKAPKDSTLHLRYRSDLLSYLKTLPQPWRWSEWLGAESPVAAEYRESAALLATNPLGQPLGQPPPATPAIVEAGASQMLLDGQGRLREFSAMPEEGADPLPSPVLPEAVFRAAGLPLSGFTETAPVHLPHTDADEVHAWKGPHPVLPHTELGVEIGLVKGRVTWAKVRFPWDKSHAPASATSFQDKLADQIATFLYTVGLLLAILMARRNWQRGRGDRKGALRVAAACFILEMARWFGTVHAAPDASMLSLLYTAAGNWLLSAGTLWIVYLALEPALRARWPHSIVTWNRLLAGSAKDAQVGAHILVGAPVGILLGLSDVVVPFLLGDRAPDGLAPLSYLVGARQWLGLQGAILENSLIGGLAAFFCLFCVRLLVRRDVIAAALAALVFVALGGPSLNSALWVILTIAYFLEIAFMFLIALRLGLLMAMVAFFFASATISILLGSNWNAWYAPYALATITWMLAIAGYAFWRSLAGRELLSAIP